MPSRVSALILGACTLASLSPSLKAQGLPTNLTVTSGSSPVAQANQTITTSGTVTVSAGTSVTFQAGNTITLQNGFHATAGSNFHAFLATPDFVINVTPTSGSTTLAGGSIAYNVTVSSIFNFTGTVYFSAAGVTGLPQGATASFSASSITPPVNSTSSPITLTIRTASGITGNYAFTVVGTSLGYPSHLGTSSLAIQDFYLTLSPSTFTVGAGGTATYQISATGINGFAATVSLNFAWKANSPCVTRTFPSQVQPGNAPVSFTMTEGDCGLDAGAYVFNITGTGNGFSRLVEGSIVIAPGNPQPGLTVSCSASPNPALAGQTVTFTANPSGYPSYSWSGQVSGSAQTASFVPPAAGIYGASVIVTDSNGRTGSSSCSVNVQQGGTALTILTSTTLPYGTAGSAYSQTLAASGGTGSYTWSALSTLPTGLTLSTSGVLSGTPTTAGSYTFYIKVADTGGHSVSSEFALTIASGGAQSSVQVSLAYPQLSGGSPGGIHQFTFHFTDPLGPSDISGGQIAFNIDTTAPDLPVCQLDWNIGGNLNITGITWGNFGGGQLSSMYCNVYTGESSLTKTAQGYDVSVVVSFPEALPNPLMPAWTRGIPIKSGTGDFTPVGARSLSPRIALDQVPGDGYCGGTVALNGYLSLYANGAIVGAVGASTPDVGYAAGWQNQVSYGQIYSLSDVNNAIATNPGSSIVTIDSEESILPIPAGAPYPTVPGGVYYTQANYGFTNPNCTILLEYGAPGVSLGNTAIFPEYYIEFDLSGPSGDPTPYIDNIAPSVISTGPTQVTITGGGFGTVQGSLAVCYAGANPCTSSDVTYSLNSWGANTIVATLNVPSTDNGNSFDIEVVSNGSLGSGFQSTGTSQATSNRGTVKVQASYTVSGRVTNSAGNSVASVEVETTNTPLPFATYTDDNGYYSLALPAGGSYTIEPSEPTGNYWFDPQNSSFFNLSSNQTENFTEKPVTYVYLIHGIGQSSTDMQTLYQSLTGPTGVDTRKYYVDAGFTFGCATSCDGSCTSPPGTSTLVNAGALRLGSYISQTGPPGNIIFVGYSMGGLIARDLIANNYFGFLNGHPVTALITLGTPNLGYPYASIDQHFPGACSQLLLDMAGSWQETTSSWYELTSPYLDNLRQQWVSASYSGYWMAAAGEQCSNPTRNVPVGSTVGCPPSGFTSDGVVCRDSALYGVNGSFGPYLNDGLKPYTPWLDTNHQYVHTSVFNGWGSGLVLCPNNPNTNFQLYKPPASDALFQQVTAVISAH